MTAPQHDSGHSAGLGEGTDITADALSVESEDGDSTDLPATSDPAEYVDDADLGGTGGQSSGGAG